MFAIAQKAEDLAQNMSREEAAQLGFAIMSLRVNNPEDAKILDVYSRARDLMNERSNRRLTRNVVSAAFA